MSNSATLQSTRDADIANNFYPTPPEAVRALLSVERFDAPIWEPACGDGAIATELAAARHQVVATDLNDYGFGETGINFLTQQTPRATHIVTNPPYGNGLADRFVEHALTLARQTGGKVAMLLNLASLCHPNRTSKWRNSPPARIYAIDGVLCWSKRLPYPPPAHFQNHRYCWAVWAPDHHGLPRFWWLSAQDFCANVLAIDDRPHDSESSPRSP